MWSMACARPSAEYKSGVPSPKAQGPVVLLTGAGLWMKSLVALHGVELEFRPDDVRRHCAANAEWS